MTKEAKRQLKINVNYKSRLKNISNNETEITTLLRNHTKHLQTPQQVIENELHNQEENFKQRLKLKKKNQKTNYATEDHQVEFLGENFDTTDEMRLKSNFKTNEETTKELILDDFDDSENANKNSNEAVQIHDVFFCIFRNFQSCLTANRNLILLRLKPQSKTS